MNNDTVYRKDVEQMLANIGGCDASEEWERGWDEAIDTALDELRKVKSASEEGKEIDKRTAETATRDEERSGTS